MRAHGEASEICVTVKQQEKALRGRTGRPAGHSEFISVTVISRATDGAARECVGRALAHPPYPHSQRQPACPSLPPPVSSISETAGAARG